MDQNLVSLTQEFNQVLWNDLEQSGIFDLVSKSYYPLTPPREPQEVDFKAVEFGPGLRPDARFRKDRSH